MRALMVGFIVSQTAFNDYICVVRKFRPLIEMGNENYGSILIFSLAFLLVFKFIGIHYSAALLLNSASKGYG